MIKNLTPHVLNIYDENKELVMDLPSSGLARISVKREIVNHVDGVPIYKTTFGEPEGLPEPEIGVVLVVSSLFKSYVSRAGLVVPGELLRDENGLPVGCIGLSL